MSDVPYLDRLILLRRIEASHPAHMLCTAVLELGTRLELATVNVLCDYHARSPYHAQTLRKSAFGRMNAVDRIKLLKNVMRENDLIDRWPFVIPVLEKFTRLRNEFAHGSLNPHGGEIDIFFYLKSGAEETVTYTLEYIAGMCLHANACVTELESIWATLVPTEWELT